MDETTIGGYEVLGTLPASKRFQAFRASRRAPEGEHRGTLYLMTDEVHHPDLFIETADAIRAAWPFADDSDREIILPKAQLWTGRPWFFLPDSVPVAAAARLAGRAAYASLAAQLRWLEQFQPPGGEGHFAHGDVRKERIALFDANQPLLIAPGWVAASGYASGQDLSPVRSDDTWHLGKLWIMESDRSFVPEGMESDPNEAARRLPRAHLATRTDEREAPIAAEPPARAPAPVAVEPPVQATPRAAAARPARAAAAPPAAAPVRAAATPAARPAPAGPFAQAARPAPAGPFAQAARPAPAAPSAPAARATPASPPVQAVPQVQTVRPAAATPPVQAVPQVQTVRPAPASPPVHAVPPLQTARPTPATPPVQAAPAALPAAPRAMPPARQAAAQAAPSPQPSLPTPVALPAPVAPPEPPPVRAVASPAAVSLPPVDELEELPADEPSSEPEAPSADAEPELAPTALATVASIPPAAPIPAPPAVASRGIKPALLATLAAIVLALAIAMFFFKS